MQFVKGNSLSFIGIFLCLILWACQQKSSGTGEDRAENSLNFESFLVADDLKSGANVEKIDKKKVKSTIESNSKYIDEAGNEKGNKECFDKKLDKVVFSAKGNTMGVSTTIDIVECFKESLQDAEPVAGEVRLVIMISCSQDDDLSGFDGKTFGESTDLESPCTSSVANLFVMQTTAKIGFVQNNTPYTMDMIIRSSNSKKDMTPCTAKITGNTVTDDAGCFSISKTKTTTTKSGSSDVLYSSEEFTSHEKVNLLSKKGRWYAGGYFDVIYNNWTGKVTYKDEKTAPTYTLTNGTDTITGTIVGKSNALSLTQLDMKEKNILQKMLESQKEELRAHFNQIK